MNIATVAYDTDEEIVDSDEEECKREGALQHVPAPLTLDPRTLVTSTYPLDHSAYPAVGNINVDNKSVLHIGPKIDYIVQNVDNSERVKELPFPQYLASFARNTSGAERVACLIVLAVMAVCLLLVLLFTLRSNQTADPPFEGPDIWYVDRETWLSRPKEDHVPDDEYGNQPLVVINHSVSAECHTFNDCAAELRNLQRYFVDTLHYSDLPYNFAVGNDGRVYEIRGWRVRGAHTKYLNSCTVGIGYLGDYRSTEGTKHTKFTEKQILNTQKLLAEGVAKGYLVSNYTIVGHRDLVASASPGDNIYNVIQTWPQYNKDRYSNKTCLEIKVVPPVEPKPELTTHSLTVL